MTQFIIIHQSPLTREDVVTVGLGVVVELADDGGLSALQL